MTGERRLARLRWVLWVLILLAIGIAAGAGRIWLSDFTAINGDFQTYNVLRRFLDGQVPYRDFANYLGMGVLWLNGPLLLLRNTFTASLFITNAVTAVLCTVTVWLIVWLITRRQALAMAVGALTPLLYRWTVTQGIFTLFVPGTSMRMVRAFLPVLLAGVLLALSCGRWDSLSLFHSRRTMTVCGGVLGLAAVWANDFGYAALGAGACILLVLTVVRNPRRPLQKVGDYLCFLGAAAVGFLAMVTVVTGGAPGSFFRQSAGVAEYQFWYYGMDRKKLFTLSDLPASWQETLLPLAVAAVILAVFVALFALNRLTLRGAALLFIELTALFAHLIYGFGSGRYLPGFLQMVQALILAGTVLRLGLKLLERFPGKALPSWLPSAAPVGALALLCLWSGWQAGGHLASLSGAREGTYVAELDGWFSDGEQIQTAAELLEGERYFSTYASAIETVHGVFQPTGTDYIIHALGEGQQAAYLEAFAAGDHNYAVTIRKEYTPWEWWIQRANWYFYRALYADYVPVQAGDYALIWQRQPGGARLDSVDYELTVQRVSDGTVCLSLRTGPSLSGKELVADVALSYETGYSGLVPRRALVVDDGTLWGYDGVYYLQAGGHTVHIPIAVKDGVGSVTLTACPEERGTLPSVTAQVEQLFDQERMDGAFYG